MLFYRVDIDGVLCETEGVNYEISKPIQKNIDKINTLYDNGNIIIIESGRHWKNFILTEKQLKEWKVKYHSLILGKVPGFVFDDKAILI